MAPAAAAAARRPQGGARKAPARAVVILCAAVAAGVLAWVRQARGKAPAEEPLDTAVAHVGEAFLLSKMPHVQRKVQASFPGAMRGGDVALRVLKALRTFGVTRNNVVYGHSICSDEINGDRGHVSTLLTRWYGTSFFLGGIGGAPYVGKTGFGAFAAHVPDGGHVVLLFGPHIGFSPNGEPGKFLRTGQLTASTSCGAAIAALGQITSGKSMPFDQRDIEQSWLREKLRPFGEEISKSGNQMVELAMKNYKVVEDEVKRIVNTNFGEGNLVLIGGIQINMPYPMSGYFMPLHFSIRSKTRQPMDLMPAFT
eukprot:CAMPEP_0175213086 /NCGR_PEP_ID=MMETSP0093-20121207/16009_1 /TAXON_ID=311494 /ORGANISM="Alexandrium monilatum, Strain CCMP3105" /LENGTH=310 /DNA_ID=CAMNT_0016506395 /DNA_START=53 /DNA_END=985 /DNA_ORIENTATION=-